MKKKNKYSIEEVNFLIHEELRYYRIYDNLKKIFIKKFNISNQYLERSKKYEVVIARMIFFFLLKEYTPYSIRDIARLFNIKNANKVFYLVKLMDDYINRNLNRDILNIYFQIKSILEKYEN